MLTFVSVAVRVTSTLFPVPSSGGNVASRAWVTAPEARLSGETAEAALSMVADATLRELCKVALRTAMVTRMAAMAALWARQESRGSVPTAGRAGAHSATRCQADQRRSR